LITLDILLYGLSLSLEFVALVVLRIREPHLPRPFRVPGGLFGAVAVGVFPVLLLALSVVRSQQEQVFGVNAFWLGAAIITLGVVVYPLTRLRKRIPSSAAAHSPASELSSE
jgi:amino acid transporter